MGFGWQCPRHKGGWDPHRARLGNEARSDKRLGALEDGSRCGRQPANLAERRERSGGLVSRTARGS